MTDSTNKVVPPEVTEEDVAKVASKRQDGFLLQPADIDILMRKTAQEMRAYAKAKQEGGEEASPIEHVAKILGIDTSALSSYFFTSYGVFQKDMKDKTNPYIAYTVALIHSLNLGYLLGTLNGKEKDGKDSSDKTS
jgi:hypothetical protein